MSLATTGWSLGPDCRVKTYPQGPGEARHYTWMCRVWRDTQWRWRLERWQKAQHTVLKEGTASGLRHAQECAERALWRAFDGYRVKAEQPESAAATIARLTRERDEARTALERLRAQRMGTLPAEVQHKLRRRIEKLEAALRPFVGTAGDPGHAKAPRPERCKCRWCAASAALEDR